MMTSGIGMVLFRRLLSRLGRIEDRLESFQNVHVFVSIAKCQSLVGHHLLASCDDLCDFAKDHVQDGVRRAQWQEWAFQDTSECPGKICEVNWVW